MSIVRFLFLFDQKSFEKTITPALDELRGGSYASLQKLADDAAKEHPEVWKLLGNLYYPGITTQVWDYANEINNIIAFWITLLICRYSQEIDIKLVQFDPTFSSSDTLDQLGTDESLVENFIWGNPISDLLVTLTAFGGNPKNYSFDNLHFRMGWLSIENIESIKNKIQVYQRQNNHPAYESWLNILNIAIMKKKGLILGVLM